ncbi:galactose-proton symporter [Escherichia coli]|uniref:Galactose-proton symporter n=1 Tax=Escherichia coli TaxID=562 RepID=A0A377C198_ECOLX|nr:galactose-proton symporter [Escherichia coli]
MALDAGVIIIPAILLLIGVFFLPDSPRWFAAKRRFVDAERVLLRLRDTSAEAKRELDEIRESLQVKQSGWALFKENSNFRRAVFLGVLLQVMQQFTGNERHHVLRAENLRNWRVIPTPQSKCGGQ